MILDDRLDVWTRGVDQTARVLVVQPYKFFEHHFRDPSRRDGDAQLSHSARALCAAHAAFYPSDGSSVEDDVVACLDRSRTKVFAGCSFFFAEEVDIYAARCAERYGARFVEDPADATHVVSRRGPMTKRGGRTWTGSGTASGAAGARVPSRAGLNSPWSTGRGSGRGRRSRPRTRTTRWAADLEEELLLILLCDVVVFKQERCRHLPSPTRRGARRTPAPYKWPGAPVVVGRRLGEAVVEAPRGQELEEGKGRVRFCNAEEALGAPG